jgi:predicted DNA-binding transcriptional regulator
MEAKQIRKNITSMLHSVGIEIGSTEMYCFLKVASSMKPIKVSTLARELGCANSTANTYVRILTACDLLHRSDEGFLYTGKLGDTIIAKVIGHDPDRIHGMDRRNTNYSNDDGHSNGHLQVVQK